MPRNVEAPEAGAALEAAETNDLQGSNDNAPAQAEGHDAQASAPVGGEGGTDAAGAPPEDGADPSGINDSSAGQADGGEIDLGQEVPAWRQHLEEAGFVDVEDMDEAAQRIRDTITQRNEQIRELQDQNRFYRERMASPGTQQDSQAQQAPQTAEEDTDPISRLTSHFEPLPAHVVEQYVVTVQDPDTGEFRREFRKDTPQDVIDRTQDYAERIQQWNTLVSDPTQFIPALEQRFQRMIDEQLDTGLTERQRKTTEEQTIQGFLSENSTWMFQKDPQTNQPMLQDGKPVYSREGQEFAKHFQATKDWNMPSMKHRLEYAQMMQERASSQRQRQPEARRQQASEQNAQRRREMQGRQNPAPPAPNEVNGVSPEANGERPGRRGKSYGERAVELLKQDGVQL